MLLSTVVNLVWLAGKRPVILVLMQSVNVKLPSSRGTEMAGTIDFPDSPPIAYAIFAHCFAGSRHTPGAARTAKQLTEFGIATLRFDFPGLGQSAGEFGDTTFSQNVDDIHAAAAWLTEHYSAPQLLMGHSLGGRGLIISRKFLEDLADTNPEEYLPKLRKPLMVLHSPIDQTVGIDNAQNIFLLTRYPKSLVSLDKTDHLLTKQGTAARAADLIGAWAEQFIVPDYQPEEVGTDAAVAQPATGTKFGVVVRHNDHSLSADRTKKNGGKGKGFTAEGLLMSALAAASTQAIKEAGKKLALDDVRVSITQTGPASFERRIELVGSLSAAEESTLRSAAKDTDVERMLGNVTIVDAN